MKVLVLLTALLFSANAHAYLSASGNAPMDGSYDTETKVAQKSQVAGYSDAILKGMGLYYSENELTGLYVVSRYYSGTANAQTSVPYQACIAGRNVATGDVAGFPCATRGYVDYAVYDATVAIVKGGYLCIGTATTTRGSLITCTGGVTSKIIALEDKASGAGANLKVRVLSE